MGVVLDINRHCWKSGLKLGRSSSEYEYCGCVACQVGNVLLTISIQFSILSHLFQLAITVLPRLYLCSLGRSSVIRTRERGGGTESRKPRLWREGVSFNFASLGGWITFK